MTSATLGCRIVGDAASQFQAGRFDAAQETLVLSFIPMLF